MRASLTTTALAAPFTSWGGKAGWVSAFGGSSFGGSEWPLMRASAERAPKRKASLLGILDMYQKASVGFRPVGSRLPDDASQPMGAQYGARHPGSAAQMVASSVVSSAKPLGGVGGVFGRTDRQLELHLSIVDDPMLTGVVR